MLVGNGAGQSLRVNSTFFVRKLGLGKEVVSLSLVVTRWGTITTTGPL